jgi:hypothetical protein
MEEPLDKERDNWPVEMRLSSEEARSLEGMEVGDWYRFRGQLFLLVRRANHNVRWVSYNDGLPSQKEHKEGYCSDEFDFGPAPDDP